MTVSTPRSTRLRAPPRTMLATCLAAVFAAGSAGAIDTASASSAAGMQSNRALFGYDFSSISSEPGALNRAENRSRTSSPPIRPAATLPVTICDDSGPGSLRDVMSNAVNGDVIDMQSLGCSTISLTSGAIAVDSSIGLSLIGPGQDALTIDGSNNGYVLKTGPLSVEGLTIANGSNTSGFAGCLSVFGDLVMQDSTVTGCQAGDGTNDYAYGAGVDVRGDLHMYSSTISNSHAAAVKKSYGGGAYVGGFAYLGDSTISASSSYAVTDISRGGGIFARGGVVAVESRILDNEVVSADGTAYGGGIAQTYIAQIEHSTISGNMAHSDTAWSYGGGIQAGDFGNQMGEVFLYYSAVSGNSATASCDSCVIQGGGVNALGSITAVYSAITDNHVISASASDGLARGGGLATVFANYGSQTVVNSTVSGNSAVGGQAGNGFGYGGGVAALADEPIYIYNSTVAFNIASSWGGGAVGGDRGGVAESMLISSIVANNEAPFGADLWSNGTLQTIGGSNNLVVSPDVALTLPADTISADPKLMPLAMNGGDTVTHELAVCSPAIDAGLNDPGDPLDWDQRGDSYARESGAGPDIGAFELQVGMPSDVIFRGNFEISLCP